MKKIHIIAILVIAAAIGYLISINLRNEVTTYANFSDAQTGESLKIVGQLSKDKPIVYDPANDPNYLSFFVKDKKGEERKVIFNAAKPQDFERSESIVLTGEIKGNDFVASDMLMKCPSKYKDEETFVRAKS
jgi:cytochrome c-type biogenesis protein CcmE